MNTITPMKLTQQQEMESFAKFKEIQQGYLDMHMEELRPLRAKLTEVMSDNQCLREQRRSMELQYARLDTDKSIVVRDMFHIRVERDELRAENQRRRAYALAYGVYSVIATIVLLIVVLWANR